MKIEVKKSKKEDMEKDGVMSWPIWEKEESEFAWEYFEQETCLILEGKAVVKTPEESVEFGAGDYVVFPEGLTCTWEIKEKIKKHYRFG